MIFLDNNATTCPSSSAANAVQEGLKVHWGNPSSIHSKGRAAALALGSARQRVADLLGASPEQLVFTSGATEANSSILRDFLKAGRILITSHAEHSAVNALYRDCAPERMRFVPVDEHGRWNLSALEGQLSGGNSAVALSWANGETGVLQDIEKIGAMAQSHGAAVLLDASQVMGRIPILASGLAADFLTVSAHKMHGPKGVGAMVLLSTPAHALTLQYGGGQEGGHRGGTENVPGIMGFGAACAERSSNFKAHTSQLAAARDHFEARLRASVRDVRINGVNAPRVPNTSNICFRGVDGMALVARLEDAGVICSQVSACASGRPSPSPTLLAMGMSEADAYASLRFAFSINNTCAEVETAVTKIKEATSFLREFMEL
tara:strand:+ start:17561 stop:18691 length:1131 start_codon:yes stop_codon:yes gene_type:complete